MSNRTRHLQIRVSPEERTEIERRARAAGQDVSTYIRDLASPDDAARLRGLIERLGSTPADRAFVLAELHDLLQSLPPGRFHAVLGPVAPPELPAFEGNYLAAMVEHAAHGKGVSPPGWTAKVLPLEEPWFAVPFASLRGHLLRESPVAYKRRNLFVDAAVGDRV